MIEISENPYRILGITCDAKFREIQKNFSKINSYLKVKREVTLPFDNVFFGRGVSRLRFECSVSVMLLSFLKRWLA